jgi:hypothetical protein
MHTYIARIFHLDGIIALSAAECIRRTELHSFLSAAGYVEVSLNLSEYDVRVRSCSGHAVGYYTS